MSKESAAHCTMLKFLRNIAVLLLTAPLLLADKYPAITGNAVCEAGPDEGHVRVSCRFSEEIVKAPYVTGVVLLRQSVWVPSFKKEIAVPCYRFPFETTQFTCFPTPGYSVQNISNILVVDIEDGDSSREGRYSCVVLPESLNSQSEKEHCLLRIPGTDAPLATWEGTTDQSIIIILAVVSAFLVAVVVAGISAFCVCKRRCMAGRKGSTITKMKGESETTSSVKIGFLHAPPLNPPPVN